MTILNRISIFAQPLLNFPYILRTRRNHGLEHATIHILSKHRYSLSGRSSDAGFILFGDVPTDRVENAVQEALRRMKGGEHSLALHPNCGTNLVTAGFLATLVAWLGFSGASRKNGWDRFPAVMIGMMSVVLFSTPLGMSLQKHFTTEGDPGDLELVSVTRDEMNVPLRSGKVVVHRVVTRQG